MRADGVGVLFSLATIALGQQAPQMFTAPDRDGGFSEFRVRSDLVAIPVSVTDRRGHTVLGLEQRDFAVIDEGESRAILAVSRWEGPASIGIVFDSSGSMRGAEPYAGPAIKVLLEGANGGDRAFLVTFADRPRVELPLTSDLAEITNRLVWAPSYGSTALFDAIFEALRIMHRSQGTMKAIVVVTDGGDNHSRQSFGELLAYAREQDVQVYNVLVRNGPRDPDEQRGRIQLDRLAQDTGGQSVIIDNRTQMPAGMAKINELIRNKYLIEYRPPAGLAGKWRHVRVQLRKELKDAHLRLSGKDGYFAPE